MYILCNNHPEDSSYLFLSCSFARKLWEWLGRIFDFNFDLTSIESIFLGCNGKWSPQVHGVWEAAIIHTINTMWYCRNLWRFENKKLSLLQAQLRIKLATSFSGNHSKLVTNNSVDNFGWRDIWLECDSALVVDFFSGKGRIPWKLANKWHTCLEFISSMRFKVTHIYRVGNTCADRLAAFGVYSQMYTWWDVTPRIILEEFNKNRLGLPSYRFNYL
ncbi:hypothetical protein Lal_00043924 [Lupinus albus]|nr:hypothetical protein Lal_00043924 [Lupinus albus]